MTPSRIERLKQSFKPRPRRGAAPQPAAPAQGQAAAPPAAGPAPGVAPPPAAPNAAPPPAAANELAARREQLAGRYRELQSDLGGLVYEMALRDQFRLDIVLRRATELQAVDAELTAVEQALGLAPPAPPGNTCPTCGAAALAGTAYCGQCGAPMRPAAAPATPGAPR